MNDTRGGTTLKGIRSDCYIIAEAGLNHNGSIEIAKKLIDLASLAGADAVKFQKRTVDTLAVTGVLDAPDERFPEFGSTYREIREHLEFNLSEYGELRDYSRSRGLDFLVTAFDIDAVDFLLQVGVDGIKLASHSLTNDRLLKYLAGQDFPVILSTGMCELDELDKAVSIFAGRTPPLALMHCVSAYPTPISDCNIAMVETLRARYGLVTGYSGHELGYLPTLVAVARGAQLIERHYTLDNDMVGFDHKMSLGPAEFISMVREIRRIDHSLGNGVKALSPVERVTRNKYHVSLASSRFIEKGVAITEEMIEYRNPGTGIPPKEKHLIVGKVALRDIEPDVLFSLDMVEV